MTFQRRLGLAFALMAIPLLMVAALAYRSNRLEREALEDLGEGLGRSRTYAEVESALQAEGEIVWRALSGFEEDVPRELETNRQVATYWLERWEAGLRPEERRFAVQVRRLRAQIDSVTDSVVALSAAGRRDEGYRLARRELKARLFPELTALNQEIYRQARTASVQRAFVRVEEIVDRERRLLFAIMAAAIVTGCCSPRDSRAVSCAPSTTCGAPWRSWARATSTTPSPPGRATRSATSPAPSAT